MSTEQRSDSERSAFYIPIADRFASSELTRGPWDPDSQHAGPPSALVARAIERCPGIGSGPADRLVGRITLEILRPVPIGELRCTAAVARPGRRVELVEAELEGPDGERLIAARAWRLRRAELDLPADPPGVGTDAPIPGRPSGEPGAPAGPEGLEPSEAALSSGAEIGFHTAMELRFARGAFTDPGPAVAWMRMRCPLVAGEQPSPLQRLMVAADTGNGISAALDFQRYTFINVELSVHLHRLPEGEWVCLDSRTTPARSGVGLAETMLLDERGPVGQAMQTLLVAER